MYFYIFYYIAPHASTFDKGGRENVSYLFRNTAVPEQSIGQSAGFPPYTQPAGKPFRRRHTVQIACRQRHHRPLDLRNRLRFAPRVIRKCRCIDRAGRRKQDAVLIRYRRVRPDEHRLSIYDRHHLQMREALINRLIGQGQGLGIEPADHDALLLGIGHNRSPFGFSVVRA